MKTWKTWATAAAMLALTGAAQADLFDRGGGMIYDSTFNITWLADMNYAKTSGADADGLMDWTNAFGWADALVYGGHSDWRLPSALNAIGIEPCYGYTCTGSEIGHLFIVDLGNKVGQSVLNQTGDTAKQVANAALFSNVQSDAYWSGTEYIYYQPGGIPVVAGAWSFYTSVALQAFEGKGAMGYAVAVHAGDVAAVPEPGTNALLLLGVGAVVVVVRRRLR